VRSTYAPVGRELGVQSVLEGSIRRAGNRVRITAQLIDAGSGGHLWADRYDRDLTDIFAVQDDVTHRIVDALKVTLGPEEKARPAGGGAPVNMEAYDYSLRGREILLGPQKTRETFEQATALFRKAIEIDPNFAVARAGLGFAYMFDYQNRWSDDPDASLALAKEYAESAIEKDPKEPLSHAVAAVAATFRGDLTRAQSEVGIALSLNPNLAMAYNIAGSIRMYAGEPLEAIRADRARHPPRPGGQDAISALPRLGEPRRRQIRNGGCAVQAAHCAGAGNRLFAFSARLCARSSRPGRRGPPHLARTRRDQSEVFVQRAFGPAAL
jgi:hypothetical protein